MKPAAPPQPVAKHVVLVGAGNAHLQFVKRWGMRPVPGVAVTLVNESSTIPYSAMVPAHLAGDYRRDEITIDLVRLCRAVNVRFVAEPVTRIDTNGRRVCFADRPPLTYDVLSLGLGSLPACPGDAAFALTLRPLGKLLQKIDALEADLKQSPRPFHFAVVGGGASGCELALAIHKRLGDVSGLRMTLFQGNERLLPQFPTKVGHIFGETLQQRGITVRLNARATGCEQGMLLLEKGERLACDTILWATDAAPPPVLKESGLTLNAAGFLLVADTLQSVGDPAVFGTGDCVHLPSHPDLPKNGVYAVREGVVLFDNVTAFLRERPLRAFRPQRFCLYLLNTADSQAILSYGPFAVKGRWARLLKNRIDRAWIDKFTKFAPMAAPTDGADEATAMRCGGCGSKISSDVLSAVLKRIEISDDPRVLLGTRAGEDAAVFQTRPELYGDDPSKLVEVQTVDYFKAFVDDPYLFGRVAALNAVSDLYAMNARPFSALAIATLPYARGPVQEAQLYELVTGAVRTLRELGVVLAGGHTTEGSELALGFAVTGHGEEDRLFHKGGLCLGDRLILTKPLGSGALLAAWMRGECQADWFDKLVQYLLVPNKAAAEVFAAAGVTACTDVTGFGLAGHLLEMLHASRLSAQLDVSAVPLYAGFKEVVLRGIVSSLHADNAKAACRLQGLADVPANLFDPGTYNRPTSSTFAVELPAFLFDPQTSGGLLAGVGPGQVTLVLEQLRAAGYGSAAVIGEVVLLEINGGPAVLLA